MYVYCSNIQTVGIVFVMVGVGCVYIAGPVTLKTAVCADTHDTQYKMLFVSAIYTYI